MKTNKVPFAYDEKGDIYDFKNAVKDKDYYCQCGEIVKIRGGEKISNHFYHTKETECCNESIIHKAYKQVFLNEKKIMLPELFRNNYLLIFDSVILEKQIGNYRPDAIGYIDGDEYLIEFAKTSFIGDRKLDKIRNSNLFCIEITIDTSLNTIDEIKEHIINKKSWKDIIHIPGDKKFSEFKEKLSVEFIEKIRKIDAEYKEIYKVEINSLKEKIKFLESKISEVREKPVITEDKNISDIKSQLKDLRESRFKNIKLRLKHNPGGEFQVYESDDKKLQGFLNNGLMTFREL